MQQKSHQVIACFWCHCHKSGESLWNWDKNNLIERKQNTPPTLTILLHQLRDVVYSLPSPRSSEMLSGCGIEPASSISIAINTQWTPGIGYYIYNMYPSLFQQHCLQ